MSDQRAVSDLVFRDLAPDDAEAFREYDAVRTARLREELDKLRPPRRGPRVVPASEAAHLHAPAE
jgi:hypothetical protein